MVVILTLEPGMEGKYIKKERENTFPVNLSPVAVSSNTNGALLGLSRSVRDLSRQYELDSVE